MCVCSSNEEKHLIKLGMNHDIVTIIIFYYVYAYRAVNKAQQLKTSLLI